MCISRLLDVEHLTGTGFIVFLYYVGLTAVTLEYLKSDDDFNSISKPRVKQGIN